MSCAFVAIDGQELLADLQVDVGELEEVVLDCFATGSAAICDVKTPNELERLA